MKPDYRFAKANRLTNGDDFTRIFNAGRRYRAKHFVLLWQPNPLTTPRLGIAVAKRSVRKACDRNKIKRIIRESFRTNKNALEAVDIIIQVTPAANDCSASTLSDALPFLWAKIFRANIK